MIYSYSAKRYARIIYHPAELLARTQGLFRLRIRTFLVCMFIGFAHISYRRFIAIRYELKR
jgi:hypothetical protein